MNDLIIFQQAECPTCRRSWDLPNGKFVAFGEQLTCTHGCGEFAATGDTVNCCLEDLFGLVLMPLADRGM